jgi:hypothetical protein
MKKLFFYLVFILVLIVILNQVIFSCIKLPYAWGPYYANELCLEKNAPAYNTVILGSSRVHRQISSVIFDSLNQNVIPTRTFMFGIDAMTIDEEDYLFHHILATKNLKPDYMIVELCDVDVFAPFNMHTLRKKYYYSPTVFFRSVTCLWYSEYTFKQKFNATFPMAINALEKLTNFDMLSKVYKFKHNEEKASYKCGEFYDPFSTQDTSNVMFQGQEYRNSHIEFMTHWKDMYTQRDSLKILLARFRSNPEDSRRNPAYWDIISRMIEKARQKNIKLIFFVPPKLEVEHFKNVLPVYFSLSPKNRIEMADPDKYAEFYELQYTYNIGHVNKEGSVLFTQKLSSLFLELEKN